MQTITKENKEQTVITSPVVWKYVLQFLGWFILFYWGTEIIWGLTTPHHYYIPWLNHYFNYIMLNRVIVLESSRKILEASGYYMFSPQPDVLTISGEYGIILNYSCLGFAIISFWMAFVITHHGSWWFKIIWAIIGLAIIIVCNIARVCLVLLSGLEHWSLPFRLDHHTWYNIITYAAIIVLAFFYNYFVTKKRIQ
ncbi:MAG: exosortase/archaeosortase family protein [Sphingobacteriales bacterium]|uniref:exosortase/archaeosortase family protein n=1 Tax=Hydrotalea flava TaxID=714549 RepID=UPI000833E4A2|nr:exosortase/archaeosortase family protein [Hydrotalea flava]RTL56942.1 MAG: exosortase/archaeosortase family protein [Sphingobacteriales bacterium]